MKGPVGLDESNPLLWSLLKSVDHHVSEPLEIRWSTYFEALWLQSVWSGRLPWVEHRDEDEVADNGDGGGDQDDEALEEVFAGDGIVLQGSGVSHQVGRVAGQVLALDPLGRRHRGDQGPVRVVGHPRSELLRSWRRRYPIL